MWRLACNDRDGAKSAHVIVLPRGVHEPALLDLDSFLARTLQTSADAPSDHFRDAWDRTVLVLET